MPGPGGSVGRRGQARPSGPRCERPWPGARRSERAAISACPLRPRPRWIEDGEAARVRGRYLSRELTRWTQAGCGRAQSRLPGLRRLRRRGRGACSLLVRDNEHVVQDAPADGGVGGVEDRPVRVSSTPSSLRRGRAMILSGSAASCSSVCARTYWTKSPFTAARAPTRNSW